MAHFSRHKDLTQVKGNPCRELRAQYNRLMEITDPGELQLTLLTIMRPFIGNGLSWRNWEIFRNTIDRLSGDLIGLQRYATNYLLAAMGLATCK